MRLSLYSVFDIKMEKFYPPYASENDAVGDRHFMELLTDPKSMLSRHPEDYRLFRIGEFDEWTGEIVPLEKGIICVNQGMTMGRPIDVAAAEEEGNRKFAAFLASRGLEVARDGQVRQLDRGGR